MPQLICASGRRTDVDDIAATAGIEMQGRVACWTVLRLDLSNEFVEAGLVGDMGARELEDTLALEGVFEGFFADGAFAPDECSFSP